MNESKCIYCGRGKLDGVELSISDIIPDGLTNKTITNKNVCKIEHNNKFSDQFESYVINELEFLRNYLGIKNKNGKLPSYTANYEFEGAIFTKKLASKKDFYSGNIIPGKDESSKMFFGAIEELGKISNFNSDKLKEVSPNGDVTQVINLKLNIFYAREMKRMIAKIGYEWYCKAMEIDDKFPEFEDIINYVLDTYKGEDLVSVITDLDLYYTLNNQVELGSHSMTIYDDPDGYTYVVYMFFGLMLYKIKIRRHESLATKWQYIPFCCIRYDGSVVHPLTMLMNVCYKLKSVSVEKGTKDLLEYLKKSYKDLMSMHIFTLRNFYSTVQEISVSITTLKGDELYNELIGYKESRSLFAIFVLTVLGERFNMYDVNKDFNSNLKVVLETDDKVVFEKDELYSRLTAEFKSEKLLLNLKKGIEVFLNAYRNEVLEKR